jgi:hypothetical protein
MDIITKQQGPLATFSSQKRIMDYITLQGIENRTGFETRNLFTLLMKELLDNAVDFLEMQYSGISINTELENREAKNVGQADLVVTIRKEANYLSLTVKNSNKVGKATFSKDLLQQVLSFDRYYSSKRNQYKISRGALGDALKEILCIPYALAREDQSEWNEPLIIRVKTYDVRQTFSISLVIDRIDQTLQPQIVELNKLEKCLTQEEEKSNFTEIELRIPELDGYKQDMDQLRRFLINYATINTHIGFTFNLPCNSSISNNTGQQYTTLSFPQVQPINSKWTNISSIYYYTLSEFQKFILGIDNNSLYVYDIIQKTFREGTNLKRTGNLTSMTAGQIKQSPEHISQLYSQLRNTMKPISSPSNLSLPFDVNKKARIQAFKKRLEQRGILLDASDIKYKSKYSYFRTDGGIEYPFFFEIVVVRSKNIKYYLDFLDSLNCSVMPGSYSFLMGPDGETFRWQTQSDRKNNSIHTSRGIFDIFEHYGYSYRKDKCKKPNSLIIVNLISPRINYRSYGKASIDLSPFANLIAEATVKVCSGNSACNIPFGSEGSESRVSIIGLLRRLLSERYDAVKRNPVIKDKQKWTQSTVFYQLRPILLEHGYEIESIDRQYITSEIKNVCEQDFGIKRDEIGITAADRAQLYFKGKWHDVGLEELNELMLYGTDMLIVEKEGVVKQLAPFADEKGIALLNTRGFLTEYASILSQQSSDNGCNIAVLTDLDASGLLIASIISNVYRVGIDFETLEYFGVDCSIVEEEYKPQQNHLKPLKDMADDPFSDLFFDYGDDLSETVEYISRKRIEIDSVMAAVNDNAKFWKYVLTKLEEKFPTRDYNRAINVPEYVIPNSLEALNNKVREKASTLLRDRVAKIKEKFSAVSGFLNIKSYEISIQREMKTAIEVDNRIKSLLLDIDALLSKYDDKDGDQI